MEFERVDQFHGKSGRRRYRAFLPQQRFFMFDDILLVDGRTNVRVARREKTYGSNGGYPPHGSLQHARISQILPSCVSVRAPQILFHLLHEIVQLSGRSTYSHVGYLRCWPFFIARRSTVTPTGKIDLNLIASAASVRAIFSYLLIAAHTVEVETACIEPHPIARGAPSRRHRQDRKGRRLAGVLGCGQ